MAHPSSSPRSSDHVRAVLHGGIAPIARLHQTTAPLSFAQQRLWFLDRLEPGTAAYYVAFALRLAGRIDLRALSQSVVTLVARHETLRTHVPVRAGVPYQAIAPAAEQWVPVVDATAIDEPTVRAWQRRIASAPFVLDAAPPRRAVIWRLGPDAVVLQVVLHHILIDGWSQGVLARELETIYGALVAGESASLAPLPIQYADYAIWQRSWLTGSVLEDRLAYWRQQLAGLEPLVLPTDRPRPPQSSHRGGRVRVRLDRRVVAQLRELARQERATLFMVLLAAFQFLMSRYGDCDDVAVGTDVANRKPAETEPLVGFFINQLVLRAKVHRDSSFRSFLALVRETAIDAYAHQDMPYEKLIEELAPERTASPATLFPAKLVAQPTARLRPTLPGVRVTNVPLGRTDVKIDLNLMLRVGDRVAGALHYKRDLWSDGFATQFCRRFERVLKSVAADPNQRLGAIAVDPPVSDVAIADAKSSAIEPAMLVPAAIAQQAIERPDAIALEAGGHHVSYAALDRAAVRIANVLVEAGVGPDVTVAHCCRRGIPAIAALLGILRAGGAFVPIDPSWPHERAAFMLDDCQAPVIIADAVTERQLPSTSAHVIVVDGDLEVSGAAVLPPGARSHLAYVIYTSGSTGRPKGVMVDHGSLASYTDSIGRLVDFSRAHVASISTLATDLGLTTLLPPLVAGATVHIVSDDDVLSASAVERYHRARGIEILKIAPSHLHALLTGTRPADVLPIRCVLLGGESASLELLTKIHQYAPGCRIVNHYGPTETTIGVIAGDVPAHLTDDRRVALGRPLAHAVAVILDRHGELALDGLPGELYIGGASVARGYHRRAALTAERFVPDHVSGTSGGRLYRTGDRARRAETGAIEFLGRADDQVKVRGMRVEPAEVEAVLRGHRAVGQAIVVPWTDEGGATTLAAYVVPKNGRPDVSALRDHLQRSLPAPMVPAFITIVETLPLAGNGKIDRAKLPSPARTRADHDDASGRTPNEEIVCGIWADVLGVDHVGPNDDFFDIGGHSLLGTQVVSQVQELFGVEVPLRALFDSPVAAAFTAEIERLAADGVGAPAPPAARAERPPRIPLSQAQLGLWLAQQLESRHEMYHSACQFRIRGSFDVAALDGALAELVRRHEILRTRFVVVDDSPWQEVDPEGAPIAVKVIDLTGEPEHTRDRAARRTASQAMAKPFALDRLPLICATVMRLAANEHRVVLTFPHLLSDGWSIGILQRELPMLYDACRRGEPSPLTPLPMQYADYALWQADTMAQPAFQRHVDYWRTQLRDVAPTRLGSAAGTANGVLRVRLPATVVEQVERCARRECLTTFMVLLGAFQLTLAAYADCDEVVCGTEVANRPWRSLAPAIGCFVNQLVIRTRCPRHDTVRTYLRRLRQTVLDAYAHQEAPFETVAAAIGGERSSARSPLFATKFVLKELAGVAPVEDVVPEPLDIDPLPPKWELLVDLWHRDHAIAGRVEFDRTIAAGIAEAFWCHLAKVVEMVASPQTADWTCARTHEAAEAAADREREAIASEPLHSYGAADAAHTI